MQLRILLTAVALLSACAGGVTADEHLTQTATEDSVRPTADELAFFESRIRPLLVRHCYSCHSAESKEIKGGLSLHNRAGWMTGGESGPAIVPGQPEESLLISAVKYESYKMPPQGKLPDADIETLTQWIKMGAPDPRTEPSSVPQSPAGIDIEKGRQFWAFQPPVAHAPPTVENQAWPRDAIDNFILERLERHQLQPAGDADRLTWLRRITFDLTGLAASITEQDTFLADSSDTAREKVVDRLLASSQFGVHWGRHWLDVARYADSNGSDFNATYYNAWRYRNYVVDSFNQDRPYDQFVREQLAGDLLPAASEEQKEQQLTATTFLMIGAKMLSERNKEKLVMDVVDEQIDTVGRAFMGMTLGCARCHDHKFDPIPTADYYALAGIFRSTVVLEGESQAYVSTWVETPLPVPAELAEAIKQHQLKKEQLTAELAALKKELAAATEQKATSGQADPAADALKENVKKKEAELREHDKSAPQPPKVMAAREAPTIGDCEIFVRGEVSHRGPVVNRGFLQVVSNGSAHLQQKNESGRRELAEWIARPDHPLTARVMVNRIWQNLLGEGLVRSVDNFGHLGELPSHGELLDTLAADFVDSGFSVKSIVRRIALSRTYAMSTYFDEQAFTKDPDNRLLWRAHRKRVPAESLRDAMLQVSGSLDLTAAESPVANLGALAVDNSKQASSGQSANSSRRSLYLPIVRNELPAFLVVFDFADPDIVTGRRPETNVPAQAMFLMNNPFVKEQAKRTAERLLAESRAETEQDSETADLQLAEMVMRVVVGRVPTETERKQLTDYVQSVCQDDASRRSQAWSEVIQVLFASTEFRMLD